MNTDTKIRSFTDLLAWKEGHKLVILVYEITGGFPKIERFSIIDQMRRAAASITSNIAEGFGRFSYKEKLQFYFMAQGSLIELKNFILIAKDVGYLKKTDLDKLIEQSNKTHQLLQGLMSKTKIFVRSLS